MNNLELHHMQHPWRSRVGWMITYIVLLVAVATGLFVYFGRARTYSLPTGGIELSTPYKTYLVGETITFTVKNNYNTPVSVTNGCPEEPVFVYKQEGTRWVRVHDRASADDCEGQQRNVTIPPNSSVSASLARWPKLFDSPGRYRIALEVQYYNAVPYREFQVIAKPQPAASPTSSPGVNQLVQSTQPKP